MNIGRRFFRRPVSGLMRLNKETEDMKRSEINKALKELEKMIADHQYYLPKFANFTPEEWKTKGHEFDEIRDNMLGWDITDYGMGDFDKYGFSLFTIRNGNIKMKDKYKKPYAEKFLYLKEGQYALNHFHWYKMEDIINRGGGNILIRVYNSLPDEEIDKRRCYRTYRRRSSGRSGWYTGKTWNQV